MRRSRDAVAGGGGSPARAVADELAFHIEGTVDELVAAGWTRAEARTEALRRFGDIDRIGAECVRIDRQKRRRQRRRDVMRDRLQDVRHALRALRRNPGFALIALLTLAVGIGATTAIFTVVDGVLLRPLPFAEADRLYLIWERNERDGVERDNPSPPNFHDWRAAATKFSDMAAWSDVSMTLGGADRPEVLSGLAATANVFDVLGIRPALGRTFAPGEDAAGGARLVVLADATWRRLYGGDPGVIGRTMTLEGRPYEIIGVLPPEARLPRPDIALWVAREFANEHRQTRYLTVVARLADGATRGEAEQEMASIAAVLRAQYPEANESFTPYLVNVQDQVVGGVRPILLVVFAAVGFVLLLACANVANLVLGRATARRPEIALRASLGAGVGRLRAQLLTENMLLGVVGGALGVGLAYVVVAGFLRLEPTALPRLEDVSVDLRVLGFALLTSLLTGLLLGAVPALRAAGARAGEVLREGGGRQAGRNAFARRGLIVMELALSIILLVGAGLAIRSLMKLRAIDPGFETERIVLARVSLSGPAYGSGRPTAEQNVLKVQYFDGLVERVRTIAGVQDAAITSTLPLTPDGTDFNLPYHAEGRPLVPEGQAPQTDYRIVSPGYFATLGIPVIHGRDFDAFDRVDGRRVVIINQSFAQQLWPGENPIGRKILIYYINDAEWEVVGVVGDTRHRALSMAPAAQMFVPMAQAEYLFGYMTLVVRTAGSAPGLVDRLQEAALSLDPAEPLYEFDTMETLLADATARDRLAAAVFGLFAILALVLSAAGIYGVVSYQVAQRTREIGVRMALGASRVRVLQEVVGEAALLAVAGIVIGLAAGAAATRVASSFLHDISARDPLTFAAVAGLLFAIAVFAAYVPAARAAGIAPVEALRRE